MMMIGIYVGDTVMVRISETEELTGKVVRIGDNENPWTLELVDEMECQIPSNTFVIFLVEKK
jgi:hypothetical protein